MAVNLVRFKKGGGRKNFPLPSSVTVIGRRSDCDLRIPLMSVSKRHCQLSLNKGVLMVRDLGSRNGTILNGKAIDETVVQAGDSLKVGPITFVLQIDGKPEEMLSPKQAKKQEPPQKGVAPKEPTSDSTTKRTEDISESDDVELLESDFDEEPGDLDEEPDRLELPEDSSEDELDIFDLPEDNS